MKTHHPHPHLPLHLHLQTPPSSIKLPLPDPLLPNPRHPRTPRRHLNIRPPRPFLRQPRTNLLMRLKSPLQTLLGAIINSMASRAFRQFHIRFGAVGACRLRFWLVDGLLL